MKSAFFLLASALTSGVVAQNRADYFPECSSKCLDDAIKAATNCALNDAVCICVQKNYEDIYNAGVACVLQACGPDDAVGKVLPAGVKFCAAATAQAKAGGASKTDIPPTATVETSGAVTGTTSAPLTTGDGQSTVQPSQAASSTTSKAAAPTDGPGRALGLLVAGVLAVL